MRISLSLVVPAFNEEEIIADSVKTFVDNGRSFVHDGAIERFELVVVNDGSTDSTQQLLDALTDEVPELRVVTLDTNSGLGAALRAGFSAASCSHVAYTDADRPFDLVELRPILHRLNSAPETVFRARRSSRTASGPRRFAYSVGYQALIWAMFGHNFVDVNFAGKVLRTDVVKSLGLASNGSFIDAEMLIRVANTGADIETFIVEFKDRPGGQSTLSSSSVIRTMLAEIYAQRRQLRGSKMSRPSRGRLRR